MSKNTTKKPDVRSKKEALETFFATLAKARETSVVTEIVSEILTQSERDMLAKRIAIISALEDGVNPREVVKALKVSSSTVYRLEERREEGKFSEMMKQVNNSKKDGAIVWLEDIFSHGVELLRELGVFLKKVFSGK